MTSRPLRLVTALAFATLLLAPLPAGAGDGPASAAASASASAPAPALTAPTPASANPTAVPASAAPALPTSSMAPLAKPAPPVAADTGSSPTASLLRTSFALLFVLALLMALAWGLKRYGPKNVKGNATLRVVGSLSLGGRERVVVIEVAGQWIVVGAAPGRVNALAVLPRQQESAADIPPASLAGTNFAEWLKQTIENRNGK